MKKIIPLFILFGMIFSSCNKYNKIDTQKIAENLLVEYSIVIDNDKPYSTYTKIIPKIFDNSWEMMNYFSEDSLDIDIKKFKGSTCTIYRYPIKELPFEAYNKINVQKYAVITIKDSKVLCGYIEFLSELNINQPISLEGKSLYEITNIKWEDWKKRIEDDDNKQLVIWEYYDLLKTNNFNEAYNLLYKDNRIDKEEFIKTAKENKLPFMDFISIEQYKESSLNEAYFVVKAYVFDKNSHKLEYKILFNLKKDKDEVIYNGWKIYSTKIQ